MSAAPSAADDALARARAIAARLSGAAPAITSSSESPAAPSSNKRRLDGGDPGESDAARAAREAVEAALSGGGGSGGGQGDAKRGSAGTKVMIPTDKNYNYVGLLIGPGGSKQRSLQEQSGGARIAIRGGGPAHDTGPSSAEPLHVLIEGSADAVAKARSLIKELLDDPARADAEKRAQLETLNSGSGGTGGAPSAGAGGSHGVPGQYGPADGAGGGAAANPVLLTASGPVPPRPGTALSPYGPSVPGAASPGEEVIRIPNGIVGYVIGKGGESITNIQRRTGCRVQIQKEHEMAPGETMRMITLSSPDPGGVAECKAMILGMVNDRSQGGGGGGAPGAAPGLGFGGGGGGGPASVPMGAVAQKNAAAAAIAAGHHVVLVKVPDADVGLIIGRGGQNIRQMQERSGANIQIPQRADPDDPRARTCTITHPTPDGANVARSLIQEVLATKLGGGGADASLDVNVPDKDVGMIIGRGGCVIRELQQRTKCRIQIPNQCAPGNPNRVITITGPAEGCQQVKQMVERMIMEQSSNSVMSGAQYSNNYQPQQQQQQGGGGGGYGQQAAYGAYGHQPGAGAYGQGQQASPYGQGQQQGAAGGAAGGQKDYSAEWAAYYAAQAAAGQPAQGGAQACAQAAQASPTGAAVAAAPAAANGGASAAVPTDPTAYYNDFWKYASYYGEEAARQYYGAWSPPPGTPNPNSGGGAPGAPVASPAAQSYGA
eukprot:CAMPEP_0194271448 /NCGR_PEP_ID=MMETSP0169-20130528/5207_1 /TAXON_ID=218684 /ORGANISM="Corethron pennatum, Strain L29A3" /LENGTH=716 /DNA_ID=CAMNT_0039013787 /DNA_START=51 /DNA_END=2201 /DNA_ORIENTATION=-